jgi:two-component system OmpR family sensor kinase
VSLRGQGERTDPDPPVAPASRTPVIGRRFRPGIGAQARTLVLGIAFLLMVATTVVIARPDDVGGPDQFATWTVLVLAAVALLLILALLAWWRFASRLTRPLEDMHRVVDAWAVGDLDVRAEPSGPTEVRAVAEALNEFADENARIRDLEQQVVERVTALDRAKSDFLSTVSHELRTPLTSIAGYVELIEDEMQPMLSQTQTSMLAVVNRNVARLRSLIEDLLTLSEAESDAFRSSFDVLDVTHLTSDVAYDLQAMAAERGIVIHEVHPDRPMLMMGDASQLSRALLNLVSNAVKFSHDGEQVAIRVRQVGSWAHLEVADLGIGIPASEMSQLATRFFRASNAVEAEIGGTGLGLRIVRAVASNHGGRLELDSVEGVGTTARLVLPLAAPGKKLPADTVETSAEEPAAGGD